MTLPVVAPPDGLRLGARMAMNQNAPQAVADIPGLPL